MADLETFDTPLYDPSPALFAGTSSSNLVPYPFPVGLGGHYYGVQWDKDSIGVWGAKFKRASKQIILIFQVSNQFPLNNFGVDLKILGYMEKVRLTLIVQLQKFVVTMMDLELTLGLLGN